MYSLNIIIYNIISMLMLIVLSLWQDGKGIVRVHSIP